MFRGSGKRPLIRSRCDAVSSCDSRHGRVVAHVTFRSDNVFTDRFRRELADKATVGDTRGLRQRFEVER